MEINKEHRSALLDELEKAQDSLRLQKTGLANYPAGEVLAYHYEVGIYLEQLRIEAIKTALRDNELYNF